MSKPLTLASLLIISTALVAPAALAQTNDPTTPADSASDDQGGSEDSANSSVDVSIPGSDIVVIGRRERNIAKAAPQVVSILSTEDIKRTGEGDIAGSLQRVTGLSVQSGGFVYVRGLGDRYSLALLNGSPLPSPEPLKRVVPLDIFPTGVIASTLVQKSYSANYPGEFGGGVINLTTKAVPTEGYFELGLGGSFNSETTNKLGYTYYGSPTDWSGFDNGSRDVPPLLSAAFANGTDLSAASDQDLQAMAMQLVNARTTVLQRTSKIPMNFSVSMNGGTSFDLGSGTLGLIATASYGNKWRTRDSLQQASIDVTQPTGKSFERVTTDNQITVNGMLGLGLEFDNAKIRWTNLYIRDTLKRGALAAGQNEGELLGADYMLQDTAWYERQLIDTQFVGEFKFGGVDVDLRGGYANSQREAPYERSFKYVRSNRDLTIDPVGDRFVNALNRQRGDASVSFSDLNEDLWSGGIDVSGEIVPSVHASAGYAYTDTARTSSRYELHYNATNLPIAVQQLRPDYLVSDATIQYYGLTLLDFSGNYPVYNAGLRVHAGYAKVLADITPDVSLDAGVRYEKGRQYVTGVDIYETGVTPVNRINNDYWLPAATLTWKMTPAMQLRFSVSKTIARPQFRELIAQPYTDTESSRSFRGNPYLKDSVLYNGDVRFEWYMSRDEHFSAAAFYKKINDPIEAYTTINDKFDVTTSFANAPEASLYGAELELQKYFPLDTMSDAAFFASRRVVVIANYTYTQSKIKVGAGDTTLPYSYNPTNGNPPLASDYFADGSPLTGQSDHLLNLQVGLEDKDSLSQQTLLLSYASKRVTSRGPNLEPDIKEEPGLTLDFIVRQGFSIGKANAELKLEARNITNRKFKEYQELGSTRVYYNLYDIGTTLSASVSVKL